MLKAFALHVKTKFSGPVFLWQKCHNSATLTEQLRTQNSPGTKWYGKVSCNFMPEASYYQGNLKCKEYELSEGEPK